MINLEDDAIVACTDLVGRTGATNLQVGYLHDNVPVHLAGWYAHAQYRGARITVEDQAGPADALEALARRLLTGAQCRCGKLVALSDHGAVAFDGHLVDGSPWPIEDAVRAGQCRWRRDGRRWFRGCA